MPYHDPIMAQPQQPDTSPMPGFLAFPFNVLFIFTANSPRGLQWSLAGTTPLNNISKLLCQHRALHAALGHLRHARNTTQRNDVYGCCEEEDVEVLLLLYCRVVSEANPSTFAVIGTFVHICVYSLLSQRRLTRRLVTRLPPTARHQRHTLVGDESDCQRSALSATALAFGNAH